MAEFAHIRGQGLAAGVHLLGHGLVSHVNHELAAGQDVGRGVFESPIAQAVDAEHEDGRVFTHHVEHGKRGRVGHAVDSECGDQGDGSGHNQTRHEFVALIGADLLEIDLCQSGALSIKYRRYLLFTPL